MVHFMETLKHAKSSVVLTFLFYRRIERLYFIQLTFNPALPYKNADKQEMREEKLISLSIFPFFLKLYPFTAIVKHKKYCSMHTKT